METNTEKDEISANMLMRSVEGRLAGGFGEDLVEVLGYEVIELDSVSCVDISFMVDEVSLVNVCEIFEDLDYVSLQESDNRFVITLPLDAFMGQETIIFCDNISAMYEQGILPSFRNDSRVEEFMKEAREEMVEMGLMEI